MYFFLSEQENPEVIRENETFPNLNTGMNIFNFHNVVSSYFQFWISFLSMKFIAI